MPHLYAALRVARLDDWGQVGHQERHGKREGDPAEYAHCDPARRHLIQYGTDIDGMDPREVRACMRRQIELAGAKARKGAAVGAHILAIASPEFFRPGDPAAVGAEDPARVAAFRDATLEAIRKRYGPIAAWRVDLDETTPVVDVFLVPMSRRKTKTGKEKTEVSYRDAFGGDKHQLERLQTWFASEVAHLGLKRGRPKAETGRTHEPAHELNRKLIQDQKLAERARAAAESKLREAAARQAAVERREREIAEREANALAFDERVRRLEASLLLREQAVEVREREVSLAEKALESVKALIEYVREHMPAWQKMISAISEPSRTELRQTANKLGSDLASLNRRLGPVKLPDRSR